MTPGSEWFDSVRRLAEVVSSSFAADAGEPGPEHGPDCRWCPLCQAAAVVRGERPEVTAALAEVLTATSAALRTFAEPPDSDEREAGTAPTEETPPEDDPPQAQQIEIL